MKSGDEIELIYDGEDEKEAMDAMVSAIEDGLENKRILDGL